jgi:hypothetical protein
VRVYDITELDGLPTIVMERLPGGTLEGGSLTLPEAVQVADGLAYAHEQGVVHRDLKPANLLRAPDGAVKIADFGIARALEDTMVTQAGTILGTLRYLSPEQAAGRPVGPAADVYSLGVVLDELLAERPREVRLVIERCRSADPRERPSAAEVAGTLRGDTLATPTRVIPRRRRRPRMLPIALATCAAAALVAAVVVALTTARSSAPEPVSPVPHGANAGQQAGNLAAWLERNSR